MIPKYDYTLIIILYKIINLMIHILCRSNKSVPSSADIQFLLGYVVLTIIINYGEYHLYPKFQIHANLNRKTT